MDPKKSLRTVSSFGLMVVRTMRDVEGSCHWL